MRIVRLSLGMAITVACCGCQPAPDVTADRQPEADPPAVETTPQVEEPDAQPVEAMPEDHAEPGDESSENAMHGPGMGHGPGRGMGRGMGMGRGGMGRGPGAMAGMRGDMSTIHAMFDQRDKITRTINLLPNGAEALTESEDPEIADLLREHVPNMDGRVLDNEPLPPMTFHPIFVALIEHADDYTLTYEETDQGIKATYQADDPFVVMLVQEHAKLVGRFIENGMEEIHKPYTLPTLDEPAESETTTETEIPVKEADQS